MPGEILFWKRIGTRILAFSILLSVISISSAGLVIAGLAQNVLRKGIAQRNLQIARRAAHEISLYMEDSVNTLKASSEFLAAVHNNPLVQEIVLENLSMNLDRYRNLFIVDENGAVVTGSRAEKAVIQEPDEAALSRAFSGEVSISTVKLSPDHLPYVTIRLPVKIMGRIRSALVVEVNLRDIWDLIDEISIGEKGRAFLCTRAGILLAHPDKTKVLTRIVMGQTAKLFDSLSKDGSVSLQKSKNGKKLLMVYFPVDRTDWVIGLQQPIDEAYLPIVDVILRSIILIAVWIALASFVSILIARGVSKPLERLLDGTRIIGNGNMEHRIEIKSQDEIGRLSRSFNEMVDNLKERSQRLEESEEKHRLLTDNVNDIIFSLDAEGCFIFLNKQAETITGYSREALIGKSFINFLSRQSREIAQEVLKKKLAINKSASAEMEVEFLSKKRRVINLDVKLVRVHDPSREDRFYGVGRDVTERKRMQLQLTQSDKLSSIGELVSGVAHELNNPLTGIMGFSQLTLMDEGLDLKVRENLEKILVEANRSEKIIQNLLSFARKYPPEKKLCQINEIIENVLEIRAYEMNINDIKVVNQLDPGLPRTMVDSHQFRQVFLNIVNNAIQAMKGIQGKRKLTATTKAERDRIKIIFEDTGPGISEDALSKVFDPFFTLKGAGEGTGLGLSISHGIIKEHGGEITVQSKEGKGTRFDIELPIEQVSEHVEKSPSSKQASVLPHISVLAVDDEKLILDFLSQVLVREGCTVDAVENGEKALELLMEKQYDLILSDLRMPGIDGRKLYKWVKENRPHMTAKLVFITGDIVSSEAHLFFQETGALYLKKPFGIEELKQLILTACKL